MSEIRRFTQLLLHSIRADFIDNEISLALMICTSILEGLCSGYESRDEY